MDRRTKRSECAKVLSHSQECVGEMRKSHERKDKTDPIKGRRCGEIGSKDEEGTGMRSKVGNQEIVRMSDAGMTA